MGMNAQDPARVLTVAGSDSGGAAGLQADLKTFTALGVYGMSVVTVVTAQNSVRVAGVHTLPAAFVARQLQAVLEDYGVDAAKTGFIGSPALVETLAHHLQGKERRRVPHLVVDPILVDHRGQSMFSADVTEAYRRHLLPLSDLVTPNCEEAALLTGHPVSTPQEMAAAARELHARGAGNVLVKGGRSGEGGHRAEMIDVFYDGTDLAFLRLPYVGTENTHGSGDTLSAAITAFLAQGHSLADAVRRGQTFTVEAIRGGAGWRLGAGHGPLNHLQTGISDQASNG